MAGVFPRYSIVSPQGFHLPTFRTGWCSTAIILFFSLQGFQLPTFRAGWCSTVVILFLSLRGSFHAGWCSTAVILFLSLRGFQLPTFHAGWCSSAVILFLSLQESQLAFFRVHGYTFPLQSSLSFTSSLSSAPGTIPLPPFSQPFAPLLRCLCRTLSSLPFISAPSPIFLLLR